MKMRVVSICLALGTLLGAAAACSDKDSDAGLPNPVVFVRDSPITMAVKAELAAAHMTGLAHLDVNTDNDGVVWLTGSVRTQETADKVASIARATNHVKAVYNGLKVERNV